VTSLRSRAEMHGGCTANGEAPQCRNLKYDWHWQVLLFIPSHSLPFARFCFPLPSYHSSDSISCSSNPNESFPFIALMCQSEHGLYFRSLFVSSFSDGCPGATTAIAITRTYIYNVNLKLFSHSAILMHYGACTSPIEVHGPAEQ